MMLRGLVAIGLVLALQGWPPAAGAQAPPSPKLLVVIVVDQMRHDYLERMQHRWTGGLKRLVTDGAVFERNFYPYLNTVTCAGHATIATGAFPSTHGIIMNAWWRGDRVASCTDDPAVKSVGYEPQGEAVGHSASQLLVPTMGDRLRERSPASRVVTVSMKPRSAIMLAGRQGVVSWLDDRNKWATSTAFAEAPHPAVQTFVNAHPLERFRSEIWTRLADPASYTGADDGAGENPPRGWTAVFPHPLAGAEGSTSAQLANLWENSPYADVHLGAMAAALVTGMKLGQGAAVDYLGVSFSALDYVGHRFGPDSHEVQDTLLRLDATMGDLLAVLDAEVGRGNYVVGLSADHGVAPIPEARITAGETGGRIDSQQLARVANDALSSSLGAGPHIVRSEYTQLYLSESARERLLQTPSLLAPALTALANVPGVERALAGAGLEAERWSPDQAIRAAALSHVSGRSGQIVIVPKPYYVISSATALGTTHGTQHWYDQHVPLIFFGAHVKPGRYQQPTTPADLVPSIAATVGVEMPGVDGSPQRQAFTFPR